MATAHLKNLVVVTGEYQDRQGNTKKRYRTIGRLLRKDDSTFIVIDRTFNLAGLPGDGDVFISLYDPKERENSGGQTAQGGAPAGGAELDDEIPFDCVRWV